LAAGKGVIVCQNKEEALSALDKIMKDRAFGEAGDEIVIEEFLEGREVSVLAFCDGKTIRLMVPVCDHKRVFDNDEGPNTGGMGAYSPPKFYTKELGKQILNKIFLPTLTALKKEGIKYKGVLYGGLIITKEGPKVLEFNCRFGDPETQVILPKLKNDLVEILEAVVDEELDEIDINWDPQFCITVVLASGGYPGKYETGEEIKGLDEVDSDIVVFHAGTKSESDEILTSGGRVLNVTTLGKDVQSARKKVYENIKKIKFKNMHYRKDIGNKENF
nr:phosphoribosylamine--glycine ligase [Candidatus Aenigmarchaeota archaeon]